LQNAAAILQITLCSYLKVEVAAAFLVPSQKGLIFRLYRGWASEKKNPTFAWMYSRDMCWYHDWQVLCLIPEPQALNKRSVHIEASAWRYVEQQLQN